MDPRTWMVLAGWFLSAFIMVWAQLAADAYPDYPPVCRPLQDIGFDVIPSIDVIMNDTTHYWDALADPWILGGFIIAAITLGFFVSNRGRAFRSLFAIWAVIYFFRTLTLWVTASPRLTPAEPFRPDNPLYGALLFMGGVRATAKDFMFSGHAATFTLFANTVARYTNYSWFSLLYWIYCILGILVVISTRQHYTVDVVVGVIIAQLTFWVYHLLFDREYTKWWHPHITIETNKPVQLQYPLTLTDATGKKLVVRNRTESHVLYSARHFSAARYHFFRSIYEFLN